MSQHANINPLLTTTKVPMCSEEDCPRYTGSHCNVTGKRTGAVCLPGVENMGERLALLEEKELIILKPSRDLTKEVFRVIEEKVREIEELVGIPAELLPGGGKLIEITNTPGAFTDGELGIDTPSAPGQPEAPTEETNPEDPTPTADSSKPSSSGDEDDGDNLDSDE
jgi:hypothetical protein